MHCFRRELAAPSTARAIGRVWRLVGDYGAAMRMFTIDVSSVTGRNRRCVAVVAMDKST